MLLSVIIPVYNCEKYIAQCVYSILDQPLSKNIQIIIVDDGSPDNSGRICDGIANTHDNVTVIHKENGGVSSARNVGLEKASGEYVAFVGRSGCGKSKSFRPELSCLKLAENQ